MTNRRFGFDFHGMIDQNPSRYSMLFDKILDQGDEVHIVTGAQRSHIMDFLKINNINFTYIYSITDDLLNRKLNNYIDEKGRPCFNEEIWNSSKAKYCDLHKIGMMFDDSAKYAKYFEDINTIYIQH